MQRWEKELLEWGKALLFAILLAVLIRTFVVDIYIVDGNSMLPTLHDQERVIVNKLVYRLGTPEPGDVVVFSYAREPWRDFVKRVIALPGDQVEIKNNRVLINGVALEEPYLGASTLGRYGPVVVEPGTVFVLGDNRNFSMDSRDDSVGLVPYSAIRGKASLVFWPFKALRMIGH